MITAENRQFWKKPWDKTAPPKPNAVRKEAYRIFEAEYERTQKRIKDFLLRRWIVLNTMDNFMKAVRVLDAYKFIEKK